MDNTKPKETSGSDERPDVTAIMARIREDVRRYSEENPSSIPTYRKTIEPQDTSPILYSEELNYLNAHWQDWAAPTEVVSHRPIIGPIIVKAKKFLVDIAWNYLLKGYFERERQFQMNLVRLLNSTARYIDARDKEIFWQLVGKIDNEIVSLNERADRLFCEATSTASNLEFNLSERISKLGNDCDDLAKLAAKVNHEIGELDDVVCGLESSIRALERKTAGMAKKAEVVGHEEGLNPKLNIEYNVVQGGGQKRDLNGIFENRFRGSQEAIKERMRDYVPLFSESKGIVLDIGGGRGEFLELLGEAEISALGVIFQEAAFSRCKEKGLNVLCEDPFAYLESLAPGSLGGVFMAQVVEHLSLDRLDRLFELLSEKVRPGGRILVETLNPQSLRTLTGSFFRDPTHTWPQHPDTLRSLMEQHGLRTEKVMMRSPFPAQTRLKPVALSEYLPLRWRSTLVTINENISRLNDIVFGFQDYAIASVVEVRQDPPFRPANKALKHARLTPIEITEKEL